MKLNLTAQEREDRNYSLVAGWATLIMLVGGGIAYFYFLTNVIGPRL